MYGVYFRIIYSVPRWFNLSDLMLWFPYCRSFDQCLLNPVPPMIAGWIYRWSVSIIWSVYYVDESTWVRVLLIILWEEVWIWRLVMLEVLMSRANSFTFVICLVIGEYWFPSDWEVYPRYVMGSSVWRYFLSGWIPVLIKVIGCVYDNFVSMVVDPSSWNI